MPEIASYNAAWSSQTGKGLLYFSKRASEKATPAGIINLVSINPPRLSHSTLTLEFSHFIDIELNTYDKFI
jgi:hypothetical protein